MTGMITLDQLDDVFDQHFTRTAFRLEVLAAYAVASDGGDVARYLAGEPDPDPQRKGGALKEIRDERTAGKLRHRVRVIRGPLTDYLRYECEWGYVPNVEAGEVIRVLDLTETSRPEPLVDEEFWLLDDEVALVMHYDDDGAFIDADLADDDVEPYRRARDAALAAAEDFTTWWNRHPQYWRQNYQRQHTRAS